MRRLLLALPALLLACPKSAPPEAPVEVVEPDIANLDSPLPWDSGVRRGVLPNGLTWMVEPNNKPEKRAELWLVVRAGSVQEDEDQQGLAHLLEHMAFNGTEHFAGNELVTYLESVGTRFGAHLNAHTSFEETVYKLQVPTDDADILDTGFTVLRDWAGGLLNTDEEIEKERGVVLEEWRRRQGAGWRMALQQIDLTYAGAPHKDRLPIGTEESLKTFTPDAVRRFYRDWYRPDLMAFVVVGDVDVEATVATIEQRFSDLTSPEVVRPRPEIPIPGHDETLVGVFTDPESQRSSVSVVNKISDREVPTHRAYRDSMIEGLFQGALTARFRDLSRDPAAPLLGAFAGKRRMNPVSGSQMLAATAKEGQELATLRLLVTEGERARRHGITAAELERAKAQRMESMRQTLAEDGKTPSRRVLQELVRHVTNGESVPGIEYEMAMTEAWLPGITLDEVNAAAAGWFGEASRVVTLSLPAKDGLETPTEEAVRAVLAEVAAADIAPPAEEEALGELMATLPTPGTVTDKRHDDELDVEVWTLSNGGTVILKPTGFAADEIRIESWTPGGHSNVTDEQYIAATTAAGIARQSGVGPFSASQLERYLTGKKARVGASIQETRQVISGTTAPKDLETALQLLHLWATAPRFEQAAFDVVQSSWTEFVRNRAAEPENLLVDRFNELLWSDHARVQPPSMESVGKMSREGSEAVWAERFAGFGAGTTLIVGAFDPAAIEPLLGQYLASLPAGELAPAQDVGKRLAPGNQTEVVRGGVEPKARVRLRLSGEFESTPDSRHRLRTLSSALSILLREDLREERGGVYSIRANASDSFEPTQHYGITVDFHCDPERVDELTDATWAILRGVVDAPPAADVTERVAAQEKRRWETDLLENNYWQNALSGNARRGEDPAELARYRTLHGLINADYVQAAAKEFLDLERFVQVTLLPQDAPAE